MHSKLVVLLVLVVAVSSPSLVLGDMPAVRFDAPAIAVAEPVNPAVVAAPLTGGELFRIKLPISALINPEFSGRIESFTVQISSAHHSMRVVDYWPRDEAFSEIEGNIAVQKNLKKDSKFGFDVSGSYHTVGKVGAKGDFSRQSTEQNSFERRPPMQLLTSSGTVDRGYGVFFKFRPGPMPVLEGTREIAVLVEVPRGWRADLMQVYVEASGAQSGYSSVKQLASSRFWLATHREGDQAAATQTRQFVAKERAVRAAAASYHKEIKSRSTPTFFHKVGAALDLVEPKIPEDYLSRIIFGTPQTTFSDRTSRLPVDVRVVVLDYWDSRMHLARYAALN